ncbi:hypothetical protein BDQ17DRAFT_1362120, partial [Cyathus striatus]
KRQKRNKVEQVMTSCFNHPRYNIVTRRTLMKETEKKAKRGVVSVHMTLRKILRLMCLVMLSWTNEITRTRSPWMFAWVGK